MVNYARETAKAMLLTAPLATLHPHETRDASALENAKMLFGLLSQKIPMDYHVTNFFAVHIDYLQEAFTPERYEMCMFGSFGRYNLGRTAVSMTGGDTVYLMSEKTNDMAVYVPGLTDEIDDLNKLLSGRAPWELEEEELEQWSN